jgi:hypothetical protein
MNRLRPFIVTALLIAVGFRVSAATHYVNQANPAPVSPYLDWSTAATTIQDAIDAATTGEEVIVADGIYSTGGRTVNGGSTNRVVITNAITVRSLNGPAATTIRGYQMPVTNNGFAAIRCVYLGKSSQLSGFTLASGGTDTTGDYFLSRRGGGVLCENATAVVENCVITSNSAANAGGGAYSGTLTNCLLTFNTVTFTNNPNGNIIDFGGGGASRATLSGCTLAWNYAELGGGSHSNTLLNCTISSNTAILGGGAFRSVLQNCLVWSNSADLGGGTYQGLMKNSLVAGNSAMWAKGATFCAGGGLFNTSASNCTIIGNVAGNEGGGVDCGNSYGACYLANLLLYYNTCTNGSNLYRGSGYSTYLYTSLSFPENNTTYFKVADPLLIDMFHLNSGSPCIAAGSGNYASGVDMDGDPWAATPSIGCDEYNARPLTGPLTPLILTTNSTARTNQPILLLAYVTGKPSATAWDFGDGSRATNQGCAFHAWTTPGDYTVVLTAYNDTFPGGVQTTQIVHVLPPPIHYVSLTSRSPIAPYTNWATAATRIQDAIDAAGDWDVVQVTNGVYSTGGRAVYGTMTNRIAATRPVFICSVNGPEVTTIKGYQLPTTTNGDGAIRCAYLTNGASLIGFTLTGGATRASGDTIAEQYGGGVWSTGNTVISNCILKANSAYGYAGGAYYGKLLNCVITGNSAYYAAGGAALAYLVNCRITANQARWVGGTYCSTNINCVISGNVSRSSDGGAYVGTFINCTITGNSASNGVGGLSAGTIVNSIVYGNHAPSNPDYNPNGGSYTYCCINPLSSGEGNIDADPQLVSDSHISVNSPCRGAGDPNAATGVDVDGEPWTATPSIGCDEPISGTISGPLTLSIRAEYVNGSNGLTLALTGTILGKPTASAWNLGDGNLVMNQALVVHSWSNPGWYNVTLTAYNDTYPDGVSTSVLVNPTSTRRYFVSAANPTPAPPYATWTTAANTIQDAVNAAEAGSEVLVTNGVYASGCTAFQYNGEYLSNRVTITKPITVKSLNGPAVTIIMGYQTPGNTNGSNSIRCLSLTNGAALSGFTLARGTTRNTGNYARCGGGVFSTSTNSIISNCILTGNSAYSSGGGVYKATVVNSALYGNFADSGGAAIFCNFTNCTITGNLANYGGGIASSTANNSIIYDNTAATGSNYYIPANSFDYCCTTPLPASGTGTFTNAPQLSGVCHLSASSPCIAAGGAAYASGLDIDGEPFSSLPSIGCDDQSAGFTGSLVVNVSADYANNTNGLALVLTALIRGNVSASIWDFNDGTFATNAAIVNHTWATPGNYTVRLTVYNNDHPEGITGTFPLEIRAQKRRYVVAGSNPVGTSYINWASAAGTIQDAVDVAAAGEEIIVSNGVYNAGSRILFGSLNNRIVITKAVTVRSLNGPAVTLIQGAPGSAAEGDFPIRCAHLNGSAVLAGFTLTNGFTLSSGTNTWDSSGGAFYGSVSSTLSNCVLIGNYACSNGGATYYGVLQNCQVTGNSAISGGGIYLSRMTNCWIYGNSALLNGGGANGGDLFNCLLFNNSAAYGAGSYSGRLYNCTLVTNTASSLGAGAYNGSLYNCIIYYNTDPSGSNTFSAKLTNCCVFPLPTGGRANLTNEPSFISVSAGNYRLLPNSPCINGGANPYAPAGLDLKGNPRIVSGTVDIGAYEYQTPASTLSYLWLQQHGLATDGSADALDPDHDGLSNYQEWLADTDPFDANSNLRFLAVTNTASGPALTWTSSPNVIYTLERATNLAGLPAFTALQTNITGASGQTTRTDPTAAATAAPCFYRIRVEPQ